MRFTEEGEGGVGDTPREHKEHRAKVQEGAQPDRERCVAAQRAGAGVEVEVLIQNDQVAHVRDERVRTCNGGAGAREVRGRSIKGAGAVL